MSKVINKYKGLIVTSILIIGFVLGGVHFMFQQQGKWLEAHEQSNNSEFLKIERTLEKLQDKVAGIEPRKNLEDMAFKQGIRAVEFYMNSKNDN